MRTSSVLLLSAAIFLLATTEISHKGISVADAQVSVPGKFPANFAGSVYHETHLSDHLFSREIELVQYVDRKKIQGPPPSLRLPHIDNAQLLNEEEASNNLLLDQGQKPDGAYQFGKAILVESFENESTLSKGRWIPLNLLKQQQSSTSSDRLALDNDEDVLVWQLEIHSKSALSLNLIFSDFHLPAGTEFYVSGKRHVLGAFTAEINNKADGVFATAPIAGDRLLLEYYTPKNLLQEGELPRIQLGHVVHGYKPTLLASSSDFTAKGFRLQDGSIAPKHRRKVGGFKDQSSAGMLGSWTTSASSDDDDMPPIQAMSGKCNVDVACHQTDYHDQSRSVGVILTNYNQKYCTGAMVNNARQDGRQLFLTANHCAGYSDTSSHLVMFNHEKVQCGGNSEVLNEHDTAMGLVKLGNYGPSDYTLYEITEPIPDAYNLYLSGWSALPLAPASRLRVASPDSTSSSSSWRTPRSSIKGRRGRQDEPVPAPEDQLPIVGIHHPSGDSKKISFFFNGTLPRACWSECDPDEYYHWQIPRWDEGTTEPGSSGSPLFDADKRIVGQLHGGSASCFNKNGYDVYGAIHASFQTPPKIKDRLATYLDPEGTGTKFMDGYNLEIARRETRKRQQRKEQSSRVEVEESESIETLTAEPLGHSRMEKPWIMTEDKELPSQQQSYEPVYGRREQFERMSVVFNKIWQRLIQSEGDREEY